MIKTSELPPTIELIDPQGEGWSLDMPAASLPEGVAEIGVTDKGVYIELTDKRYSFIPWGELTDLVEDDQDAPRVDMPACYMITAAGFAVMEAGRVRVEHGPAPTVLTGRELALERRLLARNVVYPEQPERLIVENGRVS